MKRSILLLVLTALCSCAFAQDLGRLIENAYTFDDRFPRETVYLHTDNASYIQGDTLWYKAYVVRASTLRPDSTLSRTLYVELLNDAGALLQRSILRLDSIGQAHGNFALTPPLQNGFYEIRAYTRAMTNWFGAQDEGAKGYFSRVFPLFELPKKALPGDFTQLDIQRPESEVDFKLPHERPYDFGKKGDRNLEFFPEGGRLASRTRAHIAYRLTDGHGMPAEDSIAVYTAQGELLCKSAPEHEGMGSFVLASAHDGAYAQVVGKREKFALPHPAADAIALHAYEGLDDETGVPVLNVDLQPAAGMVVADEEGDEEPLRIAVVAFSRETPYEVYPLELFNGITTLVIDRKDQKPGINRFEVVDAEGKSLASRFVFSPTPSAGPQITVRQNAESYEAYEPIAIELELKDEDGQPLPFTDLSVSVRDERGDLILDTQPSLSTQLNFASELQGYVHQPEAYLASDDVAHRRALDLLLQVQGWSPETMAQLCQLDSFGVRQPMEDSPIIRGRVIKDNDNLKPYPNMDLGMTMYNQYWHVLSATSKTDDEGVFAFEAQDDFVGDFTTEFSVKNEKGKPVWHRVMLDQWFAPKVKKYSPYEMALKAPLQLPPIRVPEALAEEEQELLFEWTDTIPRAVKRNLDEVIVKKKRPFVFELIGQEFDRYTYGGGEAHSIRHSDTFFNVDLELQRVRDAGIDVFYIGDFICYLIGDMDKAINPDPMIHGTTPTDLVTHAQTIESIAKQLSGAKDERGEITPDKVDGTYDTERIDEFETDIAGNSYIPEILRTKGMQFYVIVNNHANLPVNQYNMQMPEQLKSIIVSYDATWANSVWNMYHPLSENHEHFDGIIYVHTRPDWYNYKYVKGVTKRTLHGFTEPAEFKGPDYRRTDPENPEDFRRTLYWNPRLTTDANGRATAIFFANARWRQRLRITVRGITPDGRVIEYDR